MIETEIINQVKKVRGLQKAYFSTRSNIHLKDSKGEEKILDQMLNDYDKINFNNEWKGSVHCGQ